MADKFTPTHPWDDTERGLSSLSVLPKSSPSFASRRSDSREKRIATKKPLKISVQTTGTADYTTAQESPKIEPSSDAPTTTTRDKQKQVDQLIGDTPGPSLKLPMSKSTNHIYELSPDNKFIRGISTSETNAQSPSSTEISEDDTELPPIFQVKSWYQRYLRNRLNEMRKQGRLCDMIVKLPGAEFKLHSLILCSSHSMFTQFMPSIDSSQEDYQHSGDNNSKRCITINIPDITPPIFEMLIEYMYTGRIPGLKNMAVSEIQQLNDAAHLLGLSEVDLFGGNMNKDIISQKNFTQLWDLADHMHNKNLRSRLVEFVVENFESLWMSLEMLNFTEDRFKRVLSMASNNAQMQDVGLRALLAWVKQDVPLRRCSFSVLVSYIRLSNLSESYARFLIHHDPFVHDNNRLQKMLERTLREKCKSYLSVNKNITNVTESYTPGRSRSKFLNRNLSTAKFNRGSLSPLARKVLTPSAAILTNNTPTPTPMPTPITSTSDTLSLNLQQIKSNRKNDDKVSSKPTAKASTKLINSIQSTKNTKHLLIIGKDICTQELIVLDFSLANGNVTETDSIGVAKNDKQTIIDSQNNVYIIGGENENGNQKLDRVYKYDLKHKTAIILPDLHIPRVYPVAFFCKNSLYVTGGAGRYSNAMTQTECLDLLNNGVTWKIMEPMKARRGTRASVCILDDLVYVVGGGTHRCECFHFNTKCWEELPALPEEFCQMIPFIVAVQKKVVVFNYFRPKRMYSLERYSQTWHAEIIRGEPPEWVMSATSVNQTVYVLEKGLKVYGFDGCKPRWNMEAKIPKTQFIPLYISKQEN